MGLNYDRQEAKCDAYDSNVVGISPLFFPVLPMTTWNSGARSYFCQESSCGSGSPCSAWWCWTLTFDYAGG